MNIFFGISGVMAAASILFFALGLGVIRETDPDVDKRLVELEEKTTISSNWQVDMPGGGFAFNGQLVDIDDAVSLILQHLKIEVVDRPSLALKPVEVDKE